MLLVVYTQELVVVGHVRLCFFFFKQKTAYEMRISDWSSDVCSSDLSRDLMLETLAATLPHLPDDQPRYLMGLGDPLGMVESVALGIDLFDCVLPTRFGRHGTILSTAGR